MKALLALIFFTTTTITACTTTRVTGASALTSPKDLLSAVNKVRTKGCKCGGTYIAPVKALQWNNKLEIAARSHSDYMNRNKTLNHTGSKGSTPGSRISAAGYKWSFFAENIAMGQSTVEEVMQSWLKSPGHCKNIMNKNATEMGAAKSGAYWTLNFAAPL
ncbi:MAG: CAP domain-containing protein [Niabella sp.]